MVPVATFVIPERVQIGDVVVPDVPMVTEFGVDRLPILFEEIVTFPPPAV
jgi:hypothetical protein